MAGSSFSSFCPRISHQKGHSTHEKNIAIFAVILCITYLQNKYIGFYHDDYGYGSLTCAVDAHYAERTLPNIIDYLTRHYREWGGRVVFLADCQTKVDTKKTPSSLIFSTVVL